MNIFQTAYYHFLAQDVRYQLVILLVILMLIFSIGLVFIILKERTRKNNKEDREAEIRKSVDPILQDVAFSDSEDSNFKDQAKQIRRILKSRFFEKSNYAILNELILHYHRNLGGEASKKLQALYRQMDLKSMQVQILKSGDWHQKAKAISDLSTMRMGETLFEILQFADDPDQNVRDEAQYGAVRLGGKKALSFLDDLKSPMSEWQQIRLLDQCIKFEFALLERTEDWLDSPNDSVVIFALRVTRHLNQYQNLDQITKLLYHKNPAVQIKAINTCIDLAAIKSLDNLYEAYELTKKTPVKQAVLKALGALGGTEEVNFLQEIVYKEKHYDLVLEAARSLKRLGRKDLLTDPSEELEEKNLEIIKHILDDRI